MKKKTQKIKRGIFVALAFGMLISNVYAIPSDGVTYDNNGETEILTDTLDGLLRDADKYKTGGTVTANQMLKGATGYAKGELVTGTIESKGAETYTPGTTNQTINSGQYLSGAQTIKGDANLTGANIAAGKTIFGVSGTFTSDANAAAGHILSGKTAYVNGSKITGTIPSKGATTYNPGTSDQTIALGQYLSGNQTIAGDTDLVAGNIKNGVNLFGVNGTFTSDATVAATDILSGKTAYVKGNKITGTMLNNANKTVETTSVTQDSTYTYLKLPSAGYYDTNSQVKILNTTVGNSEPVQYVAPAGGAFDTVAGTNNLLIYQVPKTGWYIVTANARFAGNGTHEATSANLYLNNVGNSSQNAENWNWASGTHTPVGIPYTLHLEVTMVYHATAGSYFKLDIWTGAPVYINGSRMIMTLIREG